MGVQAEVSTAFKDTTVNVPWYKTEETITGGGGINDPYIRTSHVVAQGFDTVPGQVEVAQINTGNDIGKKPKITYTGNGSVSKSAKKGSSKGGKASKKAKEVKKSDVVVANRMESELSVCKDKVYTRDLFARD
jgi:hypothetical protein